jgi:hypothetical protein
VTSTPSVTASNRRPRATSAPAGTEASPDPRPSGACAIRVSSRTEPGCRPSGRMSNTKSPLPRPWPTGTRVPESEPWPCAPGTPRATDFPFVLDIAVYRVGNGWADRLAYRRPALFPTRRRRGGPGPRYSSASLACSRSSTISGTRPLTSPPYLAISLTRLELRNEYSGLVVMNSVSTFASR